MSEARPSKSAQKRQAQAARTLADRLVALGGEALRRAVDDAEIVDAVEAAQGMPSHGAGRRQRQYIAKLLRRADTAAIEVALEQSDAGSAARQRRFHAAERLRDALLSGADVAGALEAAGLDPASPIENALSAWNRARGDAARKRASRNLFRAIHDALAERDADPGE